MFVFLAIRDKYFQGAVLPSASVAWTKTLTLAISFKPEVVELSYCICVFLVTRSFTWHHMFLHCDLGLEVWPTFEKTLTLPLIFKPEVIEPSCYICTFLVTKPFAWYQNFFTLWPWPWSLTYFWKTLTLATIEWWLPPSERCCLLTTLIAYIFLQNYQKEVSRRHISNFFKVRGGGGVNLMYIQFCTFTL